jgi:hypothetical protein
MKIRTTGKVNNISVYRRTKAQNILKNYGIEIKPIQGKWNGYTFPIIDKVVEKEDVNKLPSDAKRKFSEAMGEPSSKEKAEIVFRKTFAERFPNAPEGTVNEVITHYETDASHSDRHISMEAIKRMNALVLSHIRHNYTDYESLTTKTPEDRIALRREKNTEASKIMAEWVKK